MNFSSFFNLNFHQIKKKKQCHNTETHTNDNNNVVTSLLLQRKNSPKFIIILTKRRFSSYIHNVNSPFFYHLSLIAFNLTTEKKKNSHFFSNQKQTSIKITSTSLNNSAINRNNTNDKMIPDPATFEELTTQFHTIHVNDTRFEIIKRYENLRIVGSGAQGVVW